MHAERARHALPRKETMMRFRMMYPCVLDAAGQIVAYRNIIARPEPFLKLIAPFRSDLIVGVECSTRFTRSHGSPVVASSSPIRGW